MKSSDAARRHGVRYNAELAAGWVVVNSYISEKTGRTSYTWWYGPDSGWGTTSGPLGYAVAVFPTRHDAEMALRRVFGSGFRGRGYTA